MRWERRERRRTRVSRSYGGCDDCGGGGGGGVCGDVDCGGDGGGYGRRRERGERRENTHTNSDVWKQSWWGVFGWRPYLMTGYPCNGRLSAAGVGRGRAVGAHVRSTERKSVSLRWPFTFAKQRGLSSTHTARRHPTPGESRH